MCHQTYLDIYTFETRKKYHKIWSKKDINHRFGHFCLKFWLSQIMNFPLLCNLDLSAIFIFFLQKYLFIYLYFVALFFPFLPKNSVIFSENIWSQNS